MSRRAAAFTLIELLVVVSLIVLLIAMLLPALGNVRAQARRNACMVNTHTQAAAFIAFAQDNNGTLPTADKKTYWNLNALYVMDKQEGWMLNAYGVASNDQAGTIAASSVQTAWKCPDRTDTPRLFVFNHAFGVLHVDHYMILTALPKAGDHGWSHLSAATPKRLNSAVGPIVADHTAVYASGVWTTNHRDADGRPAGHNQASSDGHARWVAADDFEDNGAGVPFSKWDSGWPWAWAWLED